MSTTTSATSKRTSFVTVFDNTSKTTTTNTTSSSANSDARNKPVITHFPPDKAFDIEMAGSSERRNSSVSEEQQADEPRPRGCSFPLLYSSVFYWLRFLVGIYALGSAAYMWAIHLDACWAAKLTWYMIMWYVLLIGLWTLVILIQAYNIVVRIARKSSPGTPYSLEGLCRFLLVIVTIVCLSGVWGRRFVCREHIMPAIAHIATYIVLIFLFLCNLCCGKEAPREEGHNEGDDQGSQRTEPETDDVLFGHSDAVVSDRPSYVEPRPDPSNRPSYVEPRGVNAGA